MLEDTWCSSRHGSYETLKSAESACLEDIHCQGVYDDHCDGNGYELCDMDAYYAVSTAGSCVYQQKTGKF